MSIEEPTALASLNKQAQSENSMVAFAPTGETEIRMQASYTPEASRGSLTTIYDFDTSDITSLTSLAIEYGERVGEIRAAGIVYSTSLDDIKYRYIGRAPAQSMGSGHEESTLDGQILTADATDTAARLEIAQRAADHMRYVNPKWIARVTLMDGFWWLIPTLNQRWTFTFSATDTVRGEVFDTSDYWQLKEVNYSAEQTETVNRRMVSATFEEETQGENAGIIITLIPDAANFQFPNMPPFSPYMDFVVDPLTYYPTDTPSDGLQFPGAVAGEPYPPGVIPDPSVNEQILNVNMRSGAQVSTTRETTIGETYRVYVNGQGLLQEGTTVWWAKFDLTVNYGGWVIYVYDNMWTDPDPPAAGLYVASTGWRPTTIPGGAHHNTTRFVFGTTATIQSINATMTPDTNSGPVSSFSMNMGYEDTSGNGQVTSYTPNKSTTSMGGAFTPVSANGILWTVSYNNGNSDHYIKTFELTGTGTIPAELVSSATEYSSSAEIYGDAFYKQYNAGNAQLYSGTNGLTVNSAKPSNIPVYTDAHNYEFDITGDGSKVAFQFNDTDLTDNDNTNIVVRIVGPNMGYTA